VKRRVVVTGLGCVSPAGNDVPTTWEGLLAGRSAVERMSLLESEGCQCHIGAPVRDFNPEALDCRQDVSRIGRSSQFAIAAALEAVRDAGLKSPDAFRSGAIMGTGIGDASETFHQTQAYLKRGVRGIHPLYVPRVMPNAPAAILSLQFGFKGASFSVSSACASAGHAISQGLRMIQADDLDVALVGGCEESFSTVIYAAAFDAIRALSRRNGDPPAASRPFERDRDGFVLGEGAGVLVLEEAAHALRRNAKIYAEISGAGMTSDAHHMTAPVADGEGAIRAMSLALKEAGEAPEEIQYINAHGTSTPLNDRVESLAIRKVFGRHADSVAVSATKSMIGHLVGASSALGVIATVLSIRQGVVHPTINYVNPDPECDLDYVPNVARRMEVRGALANSFGFGGHCVSLAARRFDKDRGAA